MHKLTPLRLNNRVVRREEFTSDASPLKTRRFAILTAENPGAVKKSAAENTAQNNDLKYLLDLCKIDYTPVHGKYGNLENSFLIFDMQADIARFFGRVFHQESVLVSEGLLYMDGSINPADLSNIDFSGDQEDFYTSVNINGKVIKFSIPIDFKTKRRD